MANFKCYKGSNCDGVPFLKSFIVIDVYLYFLPGIVNVFDLEIVGEKLKRSGNCTDNSSRILRWFFDTSQVIEFNKDL